MSNKKELTREEQQLFNELKKLSKRANQRIVRLERAFGKDIFVVRQLKEKLAADPLQAWTLSGRVRVNKSMSLTQMQATIKATENFLSNQLTTKRGIKKVRSKVTKAFVRKYGIDIEDQNVTYAEVATLANFFEDKDVNGITAYIKGSDVIDCIEEGIKENWTYEEFENQMMSYIRYNKGRGNIEELIRKIYVKYVYRGNKEGKSEIDILYDNIITLIYNANSTEELDEIENIIESMRADEKITEQEYNYMINIVNDKRNKL